MLRILGELERMSRFNGTLCSFKIMPSSQGGFLIMDGDTHIGIINPIENGVLYQSQIGSNNPFVSIFM